MPEIMYTDPIMKKYADLIQANTNHFKRIYFGEPVRIGVSELPALVVMKLDTKITNFSNTQDKHDIRLSFTVITDIRATISDDKVMVPGVNSLYNICEGRDPTTYALLSESLLGFLRHNVEIDSAHNLRTDLSTSTDVNYNLTFGKRDPASWSTEAVVTITASFYQNR